MPNPNRSFAQALQPKVRVVVDEQSFETRPEAVAYMVANERGRTAKLSSYMIGARGRSVRRYMVRFYEKV